MPRSDLHGAEVGTYRREIAMESAGVLHSVVSNLFDDGVSHWPTSNSSSGEQISGQTYPSFSTDCRTIMRVNGLFK